MARDRTFATFESSYERFGENRSAGLQAVYRDMWRARHVLARSHQQKPDKAFDAVRSAEAQQPEAQIKQPALTSSAGWRCGDPSS